MPYPKQFAYYEVTFLRAEANAETPLDKVVQSMIR